MSKYCVLFMVLLFTYIQNSSANISTNGLSDADDYSQGIALYAQEQYAHSFQFFLKSANAGNFLAQTQVAWMYRKGIGAKRDMKEALFWYKKAAQQGGMQEQYDLAIFYVQGQGIESDRSTEYNFSRKMLKQLAEKGYPPAMNALAEQYCNTGYETSLDIEQYVYRKGYSSERDKETFSLIEKSASLGYVPAKVNLAILYLKDQAAPETPELDKSARRHFLDNKALVIATEAAEQGSTEAMLLLAQMYGMGKGVTKNHEAMFQWFDKAMQATPHDYMVNVALGSVLVFGKYGVSPDYVKGVALVREAAEHDYPPAQSLLGYFYAKGYGVRKSRILAKFWLNRAIKNGSYGAQSTKDELYPPIKIRNFKRQFDGLFIPR